MVAECIHASDLHGDPVRYGKLFNLILDRVPPAVFLGGGIVPSGFGLLDTGHQGHDSFVRGYLADEFGKLRSRMAGDYPRVFIILGNDDPATCENDIRWGAEEGLWEYAHDRRIEFGAFSVYGYSFVPPSPFLLKDWEKYDVSRFVDPGCISPEEGYRTTGSSGRDSRYQTIDQDIKNLVGKDDLSSAIILFHAPPYKSSLDRAALDGKMIESVPVDVHVGSIAIQRFIEARQPLLTLHGHIHESARLTGSWRDRTGRTHSFGAAHDGPELAVVWFDPNDLENARRELI